MSRSNGHLSAIFYGIVAVMLLLSAGQSNAEPQTYQFNIIEQPLVEALAEFSRVTRRQVAADGDAVSRVNSRSIQGTFTAAQALSLMTTDTGLVVVEINGADFALRTTAQATPNIRQPLKAGQRATEEIVVVGELLERSLHETQTSVTVVSGFELDRGVDKDLFDVVDSIANVNASGGGYGFAIRGLSQAGTINLQIDGVSPQAGYGTYVGSLSTWDLQQVEVLKGSQSTQQGQNAMAGAIIVTSQDPAFVTEGKVRIDYGSLNEQRFAGAFNLPINDVLALRFSAEDYETDGDIENLNTGQKEGGQFARTYRAKLRYAPNNSLDVVLGHTFADTKFGHQGVREDLFPDQRVKGQSDVRRGKTHSTSLKLSYIINENWEFVSETTYYDAEFANVIDNPGPPFSLQGDLTRDEDAFTQEIQARFTSANLRAVTGLYHDTHSGESAGAFSFNGFPFPPNLSEDDVTNNAIFTEVEYDFNDTWTVIAGLRYDRESQDFDAILPAPITRSADYDAWLPKLGIVHNFTDNQSLGFTFQQGYRSGGSEIVQGTNEVNEFDPEYTNNYELSYRFRTQDRRFEARANVFFIDYTDMQVNDRDNTQVPPISTLTTNAGESELLGAELETNYLLGDKHELFFNIGYTKTEIKRMFDFQGNSLAGNEFDSTPRLTGAIGGRFDFGNGFFFNITGSYTDTLYLTTSNFRAGRSDAFFIVNATAGYNSENNWSINIYGRNLFDREYMTRRSANTFSVQTAGDPQVIGASLNWQF
ncbi:MAG: TonB-dependent receptor [Pseudomonadota bacterium]